jgi:hypothetical protein
VPCAPSCAATWRASTSRPCRSICTCSRSWEGWLKTAPGCTDRTVY